MAPDETDIVFHRKAGHWSVEYDGKVLRVPHSAGLCVVAHLIENARLRFRASDLIHLLESDPPQNQQDRNGPMTRASRNDYRKRIDTLRARSRRAVAARDSRAARAVEREMAALTRELAQAIGLCGEEPGTSASQIVEHVIAAAIAGIAKSNRGLARYLTRTINTGRVFSYVPD